MYVSQLAFEWNGNSVPVMQCDVYAEWVSPSESSYGGICEWHNLINVISQYIYMCLCRSVIDVDVAIINLLVVFQKIVF